MTRWNSACASLYVAIAACLSITGCGEAKPAVGPVSGIVTYKDQPVEGAQVMFTPAGGRPAEGTTDASGKFTLTTFETGDGALVGEHGVTVVKMVKVDPTDPYSAAQNALPARYAVPGQSPLKQTVTSAGVKDLKLQLTDQ